MPKPEGQRIICATCRRVLLVNDRYEKGVYKGSSYTHVVEIDGAPVVRSPGPECNNVRPVPEEELVGSLVSACDFCSGSGAEWTYPATSFDDLAIIDPAGQEVFVSTSVGDWGACAACHKFIEQGDWDAMMDAVLRRYQTSLSEDVRGQLRLSLVGLWEQFRKNRTGDAYRKKVGSK